MSALSNEAASGRRVIVVGGGLAGVTAALDAAAAGATVTLLESRGRLGGRVYSFQRDGLSADNGQHVFLRCCTAYRAFVERVDAGALVTLQDRLDITVLGAGGGRIRRGRLRRSGLPAPLHLAAAFVRYPFLSARGRLSAVLAMRALGAVDVEDPANDARTFGDWLRAHGQDAHANDALWDLITRSTVNLDCDEASLAQAAYVFQESLLSRADAGDLGHAIAPLSQIHDVAAGAAMARAGVDVRLRSAVSAIEPTVDAVTPGFAVTLTGGERLDGDAVVLAVDPERAAALLPAGTGVDPESLRALGESPIVNVHVVYDRRVLDVPFAAGVDTPVQWVFDRTESAGVTEGQYLAVTLSAAVAELTMSSREILDRYLPALAELLPGAADARVLRAFVTRDHAATFRAGPGQRALRPAPPTALRGFALAGSYTDTGWPATMEGAVRSGHAAVRAVFTDLATLPGAPAGAGASSSVDGDEDGAAQAAVLVLAPMSLEARAARAGAPWARVRRSGVGPGRSGRWAQAGGDGGSEEAGGAAVIIAGFCGALRDDLRPGDVVLASELRDPTGMTVASADPAILAGELRRGGLRVHVGPIASSEKVVRGAARRELARTGALAVDMESAWLAAGVHGRPLVTLRVVLDTAQRELHRPLATLGGFLTAYRTLRRALSLTAPWAHALGDREIMLASPRASCAGVDRAIEIVDAALAERGAPVYVRRQIVHNAHVVRGLEARGAVFVDELFEVPVGSTVIFAAHGVSPEVRRDAAARSLEVIDATCPLVAKVHAEARRFASDQFDIVLVGHEGHEEIEGTYGEAPERTQVIESVQDVAALEVRDPQRVAYLTQTTLAVDETAEVVRALRDRFPAAVGPPSSDICYATQNRQDAVRALAADCELMLVVGSANSSNSRRLAEVSQRAGCVSLLVDRADEIPPGALAGRRRIGVSAGASAPEALVADVVAAIGGLGAVNVTEHTVATEKMYFKLPPEVRPQRSQ